MKLSIDVPLALKKRGWDRYNPDDPAFYTFSEGRLRERKIYSYQNPEDDKSIWIYEVQYIKSGKRHYRVNIEDASRGNLHPYTFNKKFSTISKSLSFGFAYMKRN